MRNSIHLKCATSAVITEIGVAIVRPAEFVIFRITQSTGALQT